MNQQELNQLKRAIFNRCLKVSNQRGSQYADKEAADGNIQRVGTALEGLFQSELSGNQIYLVTMIVSKLDRITNQLRSEHPETDVVMDSVVDLHNYVDLLYASLVSK